MAAYILEMMVSYLVLLAADICVSGFKNASGAVSVFCAAYCATVPFFHLMSRCEWNYAGTFGVAAGDAALILTVCACLGICALMHLERYPVIAGIVFMLSLSRAPYAGAALIPVSAAAAGLSQAIFLCPYRSEERIISCAAVFLCTAAHACFPSYADTVPLLDIVQAISSAWVMWCAFCRLSITTRLHKAALIGGFLCACALVRVVC